MVCEEDRAALSEALTRQSLLHQFQDQDAISIVYRLMIDGEPVYHTMRILRDASEGDECLILGVLNVDEAYRSGQKTKTYNAIAKTLAKRYATIYYVDLTTNHYVEYSASNDYKELEVPTEGADFFSETHRNVRRFIHPEDLESVQRIADKTYMVSATDQGQRFVIDYRLLMNDGAHYVRLTAVRTEDADHLIFQHSPVFRTGGDEFAVILTGRDYLIRRELLLALHDRSVEHIGTEDVVISGGISEYRPGADTGFRDVFERADAQMYAEKQRLKDMGRSPATAERTGRRARRPARRSSGSSAICSSRMTRPSTGSCWATRCAADTSFSLPPTDSRRWSRSAPTRMRWLWSSWISSCPV